jgi:putative ABC transport system permease protein
MGVELAGNDRLLIVHRVSIIQPLLESYGPRIGAIEGVSDIAHATWFGGIYQDPRNFFVQMAVDGEAWFRLYPEFTVPDDQKAAWLADRTGAIAGRGLVERFGWKLGDRIPIQGTIWRMKSGDTWEFTLDGVYDGPEGSDTTQFFFHYAYLDEAREVGDGTVGWYVVRIADPDRAAEVAERIDTVFANSSAETKTSTEKAFVQGFARQIGDVGAILRAVMAAVFFTILLVAGNTMAQAVRERTSELGVLKTLGFSNARILALVLAESCALAALGGGLGLTVAWLVIRQGDPTGGFLPAFYLPGEDLVYGVAFVAGLGLAAGLPPALQAMRLSIVDALRKT